MPVYTVLASDSFNRPDENPLNPSTWSPGLVNLGVHTPCQIVGHELEPTAGASAAFYTAVSWPVSQWAQVQIDACQFTDDNDYASVLLVLNGGLNSDTYYAFEVDGPLGPNCNVFIFSQNGMGYTTYLGTDDTPAAIPLFAGDMIRMELLDNILTVYVTHNGVTTQILAPTQGNVIEQGGAPGIVLYEDTQASDAQASNFSAGSILLEVKSVLRYVTLVSDSFHRPNEDPVNPAVWSAYPETGIPANQIISNELTPEVVSGPAGDNISIAYAAPWNPAAQWAQVQIDACNSPDIEDNQYSTVLLVLGRGLSQDNGYAFEVDGPLGADCNIIIFSLNNDVVTYYLSDGMGGDVTTPIYAGDSIRMEIVNGMISAYTIHEGISTQILAPTPTVPVTFGAAPLNNGPVAIDLFQLSTPSDVQVSNFSGGIIETSVPTSGTIIGPYAGISLAQAFTNPQGLDILQVMDGGENCIYKLTNTGVAAFNPTSYTTEALLARYRGATLAEAFSNSNNLDLLQIVSQGGTVAFYVDYMGAAHTA